MRAYWVSQVVRITIDLRLSSLQLVLLGTAMELALLVSEIPTGVVADTISRKWSVVIGFVLVGLAQVGAGLVESFGLLVASQLLWGFAYSFRSGADTAWVTDEVGGPETVQQLVLRRGRLQLVVSVFSIGAGAGLAQLTSLSTAIVTSGVVLMVVGLLLALLMTENGFEPRAGRSAGRLRSLMKTLTAGARVTRANASLRILFLVLVLSGLASEAVDRLDIRRLDDLGLSTNFEEVVLVGLIAATEAGFGALVLWWSGRRLEGRRVVAGMSLLLALSAVGIAALGLIAILPVAIIGLIFQGGLRSAVLPLQVVWANAHAPREVRATVLSFIEQASSLGEVGGGIMLGGLAALTTVPTALSVSVVLVLGAAAVSSLGARSWGTEPVTSLS